MLSESTISKLYEMRLNSIAQTFREQMTERICVNMPFEERFGLLVDVEWNRRRSNRITRLIKKQNMSIQQPASKISTIHRVVILIMDRLHDSLLVIIFRTVITLSYLERRVLVRVISAVPLESPQIANSTLLDIYAFLICFLNLLSPGVKGIINKLSKNTRP